MSIRILRVVDYIVNFFCRMFKVNYGVKYRKLSAEEVKALGLDRLEKGTVVEKPTEM